MVMIQIASGDAGGHFNRTLQRGDDGCGNARGREQQEDRGGDGNTSHGEERGIRFALGVCARLLRPFLDRFRDTFHLRLEGFEVADELGKRSFGSRQVGEGE